MAVPIVGTVYPVPAYPLNLFPYIFGAYILGGVVLVFVRSRSMHEFEDIRKVLEKTTMSSTGQTSTPVPPEDAEPALA